MRAPAAAATRASFQAPPKRRVKKPAPTAAAPAEATAPRPGSLSIVSRREEASA
jgi:hypothetical protein